MSEIIIIMRKRTVLILVASLVLIGTIFMVYMDKYGAWSIESRLTSSIKSSAIHGGVFTKEKLISQKDEFAWNINGDGMMEGTFQLSQDDLNILLSDEPPLTCKEKEECVDAQDSYTRTTPGAVIKEMRIDYEKRQVTWSVSWI